MLLLLSPSSSLARRLLSSTSRTNAKELSSLLALPSSDLSPKITLLHWLASYTLSSRAMLLSLLLLSSIRQLALLVIESKKLLLRMSNLAKGISPCP